MFSSATCITIVSDECHKLFDSETDKYYKYEVMKKALMVRWDTSLELVQGYAEFIHVLNSEHVHISVNA